MTQCAKTKYIKEIVNSPQYSLAKKEKWEYDANDPRTPTDRLIGDKLNAEFIRALGGKKIPTWATTPKTDLQIEKSNHCFLWRGSEWYGVSTPNRGQFATLALNLNEKYLLFYVDTIDKSGNEVMVNIIAPNKQTLQDFVASKPIDF